MESLVRGNYLNYKKTFKRGLIKRLKKALSPADFLHYIWCDYTCKNDEEEAESWNCNNISIDLRKKLRQLRINERCISGFNEFKDFIDEVKDVQPESVIFFLNNCGRSEVFSDQYKYSPYMAYFEYFTTSEIPKTYKHDAIMIREDNFYEIIDHLEIIPSLDYKDIKLSFTQLFDRKCLPEFTSNNSELISEKIKNLSFKELLDFFGPLGEGESEESVRWRANRIVEKYRHWRDGRNFIYGDSNLEIGYHHDRIFGDVNREYKPQYKYNRTYIGDKLESESAYKDNEVRYFHFPNGSLKGTANTWEFIKGQWSLTFSGNVFNNRYHGPAIETKNGETKNIYYIHSKRVTERKYKAYILKEELLPSTLNQHLIVDACGLIISYLGYNK
jgi:hypothetical protein